MSNCLDFLLSKGMKVVELVTIYHSHYAWHKAKKLKKALAEVEILISSWKSLIKAILKCPY